MITLLDMYIVQYDSLTLCGNLNCGDTCYKINIALALKNCV